MKLFLSGLSLVLVLISCSSRKTTDLENLPKDIALKVEQENIPLDSTATTPTPVTETKVSIEYLNELKKEIDELIASKTCNDASQWRSSPLGAKPCGGPASYIAYPKELEDKILPKITKYNSLSSLYNTQNGLMSDCVLVPPPSGIHCENGKAVLDTPSRPTNDNTVHELKDAE